MNRPHKFGAVQTVVDGIKFPSKREAKRWQELQFLERAGLIQNLVRQVRYDIEVNGQHITRYVSDFNYIDGGKTVVEDCKGYRTPEYKMKARLMKAVHNITILET